MKQELAMDPQAYEFMTWEASDSKTNSSSEHITEPAMDVDIKDTASYISSNNVVEDISIQKQGGNFLNKDVSDPDSIFGEITGPSWYDVKGRMVTPPILAENLSKAFKDVPKINRPKNNKDMEQQQDEKLRQFMGAGFDREEFEELAKYCSPNHLKTGKEIIIESVEPITVFPICITDELKNRMEENTESADKLKVVQYYKYATENHVDNLLRKLKYRGLRFLPLLRELEDYLVTLGGNPIQPGKDTLFRVRVYRPYSYNSQEKYYRRHSLFSCDVILLGRQKLTSLRDRFVCPNDASMRTDVSDNPDQISTPAKDIFPSGFFFINNVFYVDTRPGCSDVSAPVRRWAVSRGLGHFPVRDMGVEMTTVRPRLGHPDVYVHQGKCEHLFTFSEIRLVAPSDPLSFVHYPCHTAISRNQTLYCATCAEFAAKWIVVGCVRVPFDPAYFCENCFRMYLYIDGKKIGDFKAYTFKGNEINIFKPSSIVMR